MSNSSCSLKLTKHFFFIHDRLDILAGILQPPFYYGRKAPRYEGFMKGRVSQAEAARGKRNTNLKRARRANHAQEDELKKKRSDLTKA